jgi:hypothetical protein
MALVQEYIKRVLPSDRTDIGSLEEFPCPAPPPFIVLKVLILLRKNELITLYPQRYPQPNIRSK